MYQSKAVSAELVFPNEMQAGSKGMGVQRVQELLTLQGFATVIDGKFGPATLRALTKFQQKLGLPAGPVDLQTWSALVKPMHELMSYKPRAVLLGEAVMEVAQAHLAAHPVEAGGDNRGPWVRMYMNGVDGPSQKWCAGFICFVIARACKAIGQDLPFKRTFSCDTLAVRAEASSRLVGCEAIAKGAKSWTDLSPVCLFVERKSEGDWKHTGFAFRGKDDTFETIEGNTNNEGSNNGYEVCSRVRSTENKDFVVIA